MKIILLLFTFMFGAIFGSFINVVIDRLPRKISIIKGRSYCPHCRHILAPRDIIPIFSWLRLKGRCRYCGEKIGVRVLIVELLGGLCAVLTVLSDRHWTAMLLTFLILLILIAVAFIDSEWQIIPNALVIVLLVFAVIVVFVFPETVPIDQMNDRLIGTVIIALPLLIGALLGVFGMGDVKLTAVAGFLLGWQRMLLAFFIAVLIGGSVAAVKLIRKKADRTMAFGPYLSIGIGIALLYGTIILILTAFLITTV